MPHPLSGSTALHVAAWYGNVNVVTALIRGGAEVNVLDIMCDALEMARVREKHRVYPILLQSGASLPAVCVPTAPDAPFGLHTPYAPTTARSQLLPPECKDCGCGRDDGCPPWRFDVDCRWGDASKSCDDLASLGEPCNFGPGCKYCNGGCQCKLPWIFEALWRGT